ncbi:hypothetical protein C922_05679 [Plasmodium inui San Antonio 1]|uniref:Uncharacterized protein n=1 Tax=Plasmodium inui San Antonio 1 TaxID=1237626 RepID=W6ZXF4_9APIC|nr:hypothetical protein C922_05679 [Plasmodium inui San Antonio 1]EUD63940.1 hypothetical protein C922_05679 [Plasmodium inui San Antonio 1]
MQGQSARRKKDLKGAVSPQGVEFLGDEEEVESKGARPGTLTAVNCKSEKQANLTRSSTPKRRLGEVGSRRQLKCPVDFCSRKGRMKEYEGIGSSRGKD